MAVSRIATWITGETEQCLRKCAIDFLPVDETSLRIGSSQQEFEDDRPAKSPTNAGSTYGHSTSSGGGTNDATPMSGKTSLTRDDVGRDGDEEQNRDTTESNKNTAPSDPTSSTSSGEKAKRLVAPRHCGRECFKKTHKRLIDATRSV